MTVIELTKGQNAPLLVDDVDVLTARLTVSWSPREALDIDVSALLLGHDGRVRTDSDFVFYNQPEAELGAVRLLGKAQGEAQDSDRLLVSLDDLSPDITRVVVLVSIDADHGEGFGAVQGLELRVDTADEQPVTRFAVPGLGPETAVVAGEVYRRNDSWRFRAVGQGYASGLAGVASDFGIAVDDMSTESTSSPQEVVQESEGDGAVPLTNTGVSLPVETSASAAGVGSPGPVASVALPLPPSVAARSQRPTAIRTRKTPSPTPVQALTLGDDDSWRAARLFAVVGVGGADEQERRATSALLSVLMGVKEFGRAISGRLGAPAGLLETYLEVPFTAGEATVIPDGVLRVARGGRVWTALLEVKTGSSLLSRSQVESYIEVARDRGYDAVVTLSNQLSAAPGEHPVGVDRRKLKKVALHHLAWAEVVHEATMQLSHRGVADPTQAWVLSELLRYLQHPRSGASGFEDMGSSWVGVREAVAAGTLRISDRKAPDVAASWERLVRQVCLRKTGELGVDVTPVGSRRHSSDPVARSAALVQALVTGGSLAAGLQIPGAVGPMMLTAHLRTGQVEVSVVVPAPSQGRPLTRINWLLRQLVEAPGGLSVEATGTRADDSRCELLKVAKADAKLLAPLDSELRSFRLSLSLPLGTKRGIGRGGFITSVHDAVDTFYRDVVQVLRPWSPPPPKLPAHDAAAAEDQPEATDEIGPPAGPDTGS